MEVAFANGLSGPRLARRARWTRWLVCAVCIGLGVGLVLYNFETRQLETLLASKLALWTYASESATNVDLGTPYFAYARGGKWWALRVTPECGIGVYVAGILVLTGALSLIQKVSLLRLFFAASVSIAILVLLNQVRFAALGYIFAELGRDAFNISHSLGGSSLMLLGMVICLLFYFRTLVANSSRTPARKHLVN
ncbi:hypothetical protein [Microbacterium maritypicum]|uniref:hypothetical protein n=1 Tax=Microbacterium maritypicum TaxID=33918 RepID=UPI003823FAC7